MILSAVHSINKYFIPDRYCVDEKLYRKTRIFINTTLITSAISFITIFSASYFGMIHHMYATGICCILFFSLAWLFRSGVSLFVCANLYLLVTFAWCAYVTFYDGALRSPTVPWLALPPVGAFFLLQSTRSGWLFAVLSQLTIITFGIIQANNPDYFRSIKEMKDSPGIREFYIILCHTNLLMILFFISYEYLSSHKELDQKNCEVIAQKKKSDELLEQNKKALTDLKEAQELLINQAKFSTIVKLTEGLKDRLLNSLNFSGFCGTSKQLLDETKQLLEKDKGGIKEETYTELLDVLNIVYSNLTKIDGHSSDAARIVKAMGQLVRTRDTRFVVTDINDLITENVNKAAEEAMAELKEFKVKIETELDKKNLKIEVLPCEIGTVVNNIIDNAFYTVHDKYQSTKDYKPEIKVSTMFNDNNCEVRIKDNGKGIGSNEKEKLFQPFQTTKPTSQGVGLGLYISYDIIKTHNGNIIVNSKEGEYTEFVVTLPINN